MKVLADTSVWSLALRRKDVSKLSVEERRFTASLSEAIHDGRVAMIGPIRQELLSGVKDQTQFDKLKGVLEAFRDDPLSTDDYEQAARLYNVCRSWGVECGPVDILICAVAQQRKWTVLSNDGALNKCLEVVQSLPEARASKNAPKKSTR